MFFCGTDSSRATNVSPHQGRYIYCNVYLDVACFGIASGDVLDMTIPGDFVLYTIDLGRKVKATIYSGNNPQDRIFESKQARNCSKTTLTEKCLYVKSTDALDLLYQPSPNVSFMHIRLTGTSASVVSDVKDFLENFRSCKSVGQSIDCTNERIFEKVVW